MRRRQGATGGDWLRRWLAAQTLPYPSRFRWAMRFGKLGRLLRPLVPRRLKPMVDMVPLRLPAADPLREINLPVGTRRARVALLSGCAQQVLAPQINRAAVEVLTRNGVEVIVPARQVCCGALSWHIGDSNRAQQFAQKNLEAFPTDVDALITTAAGCGSAIHEYPLILAGTDYHAAATHLAENSVDISVFLDRLGIAPPIPLAKRLRVAYHDACHLSHGQQVRAAPRRLLELIQGVELVELVDTEICCGSAGTYNLDQPEIAHQLGQTKAEQILAVKPDMVALGNIGCMVQIDQHLTRLGAKIPVLHTIELLQLAYRGMLTVS